VDGKLVKEIPTRMNFDDLFFSTSGKLIIAIDNHIYPQKNVIWDIETGKIKFITQIRGSIATSLDDQYLLVGLDQSVEYWNISQNALQKTSFIKSGSNIHISPDGTLLISIERNYSNIYLHNFDDLSLQKQFTIPLTGLGRDRYYWNSPLGLRDYEKEKYYLPFALTTDNSRMAIGNAYDSIAVINLDSGEKTETINEKWTGSIDFSNSGTMLAYTSLSEGFVKVYNLQTQEVVTLANYAGTFNPISESDLLQGVGIDLFGQRSTDVHSLTSPWLGPGVENWGETGFRRTVQLRYDLDEGWLRSADYLPENPFWLSEVKKSKTGKYLRYILSTDNNYMATTDGFSVELWHKPAVLPENLNPEEQWATRIAYYTHNRGVLVFSNDNNYFADINESKGVVLRLSDYSPLIEVPRIDGYFQFSRDSKFVYWITKNDISTYITQTGELISTIPINGNAFIFTPQMDILAVRDREEFQFYRTDDGSLVQTLPIDLSYSLFDFSLNQKYFLLGNPRGMLEIWGIPSK